MSIEWKSVKKDGYPKEVGANKYLVTSEWWVGRELDLAGFSDDLYGLDKYDFYEYKNKEKKGFFLYNSEGGYYELEGVIAWAKVEPYKGE